MRSPVVARTPELISAAIARRARRRDPGGGGVPTPIRTSDAVEPRNRNIRRKSVIDVFWGYASTRGIFIRTHDCPTDRRAFFFYEGTTTASVNSFCCFVRVNSHRWPKDVGNRHKQTPPLTQRIFAVFTNRKEALAIQFVEVLCNWLKYNDNCWKCRK